MQVLKLTFSALWRNKRLSAVLALLLAGFLSLGIWRVVSIDEAARERSAIVNNTAAQTPDGAPESVGGQLESGVTKPQPTEEQQRLISAYNAHARELQQALTGSTFVSQGENTVLYFDETTISATSAAWTEAKVKVYVIKLCEGKTTVSGEQTVQTNMTAVIEIEGEEAILEYVALDYKNTGSATFTGEARIKCSLFPEATQYLKIVNDTPLKVQGLEETSELAKRVGSVACKDMAEAIADFARKNCPSATYATWLETIETDYAAHTLSAAFALDGTGVRFVDITLNELTGEVKVRVAGGRTP